MDKRIFLIIAVLFMFGCSENGLQNPVADTALDINAERELDGLQDYQKIIGTHEIEVLLVNFWSAGCQACRYEAPILNKIYAEYGDRINLIAIDVDPVKTLEQARNYANRLGLLFDVFLDQDRQIFNTMGLRYLPTTLFYARDKSLSPIVVNGALDYSEAKATLDALLE